jgi:hypothetical protein
MQLAFHIGTDKAGSTAIQTHLALNRDWFGRHGLYIPESFLGRDNGHASLFGDCTAKKLAVLRNELEQAAATGYRMAIVSWEGLNFYQNTQIRSLATALNAFDPVVFLYVREQAEIVQSGFLQEIKRLANSCPITTFQSRTLILRLRQQRNACYPATRNYFQLARRWEKGLGGAQLRLRLFDRDQLHKGDVVEDFLQLLELEADSEFRWHSRPGNPSLDAVSGYLIDHLHQAGMPRQELQRLVDIALSSIAWDGAGPPGFLDAETVQKIRSHFDRSNKQLARRYLQQDGNPFKLDRAVWAEGGEAQVRGQMFDKLRALFTIDRITTFTGEGLAGRAIADAGLLHSGWSAPLEWGSWCEGEQSRIYFRLMRQHIAPEYSHIHLYIRGQYREAAGETEVTINGVSLGVHRLGHDRPGLDLPLQQLGKYESVDICLAHRGDFALEFFGFEYRGQD